MPQGTEGRRRVPENTEWRLAASVQRLALSAVRDWRTLTRKMWDPLGCWARGLAWRGCTQSCAVKMSGQAVGGFCGTGPPTPVSALAGNQAAVSQVFSPLASTPPGLGCGGRGEDERLQLCAPIAAARRCDPDVNAAVVPLNSMSIPQGQPGPGGLIPHGNALVPVATVRLVGSPSPSRTSSSPGRSHTRSRVRPPWHQRRGTEQ